MQNSIDAIFLFRIEKYFKNCYKMFRNTEADKEKLKKFVIALLELKHKSVPAELKEEIKEVNKFCIKRCS